MLAAEYDAKRDMAREADEEARRLHGIALHTGTAAAESAWREQQARARARWAELRGTPRVERGMPRCPTCRSSHTRDFNCIGERL